MNGGLTDWDRVDEITAKLRLMTACREYNSLVSVKGVLMRQHWLINEQKKRLDNLEARMFRLKNNLKRILAGLSAEDADESFIINPI